VWLNGYMSKNTTTTTTDLTDLEVLEIASELGLERIFEFTGADRSRYTVLDYEIRINHWAFNKNTYTISIDGEVLRRGGGNIVDAMRDFITAVN